MTKPRKRKEPWPPKHWGLYRAKLACKIGRDVLDGQTQGISGVTPVEYALFNLLHAIEEIAVAMEEERGRK